MKKYNTYIGFALIILLMAWFMQKQETQFKLETEARKKAHADSLAKIQKAAPSASTAPAAQVSGTDTSKKGLTAAVGMGDSAKSLVGAVQAVAPIAPIVKRHIVVETDRFWMTLDNQGARISSIVLKDLKNHQGQFPELLQKPELGLLTLELDKKDFSQELFQFDSSLKQDTIRVKAATEIKLTWAQGAQSLTRIFVFTPAGNDVRQLLQFGGWRPESYALHFDAGLKETEDASKSHSIVGSYDFSEVIFNNSFTVARETPSEKITYNKEDGVVSWAGLRRKYVAALVNFDKNVEARVTATPIKLHEESKEKPTYSLRMSSDLAGESSLNFRLVVFPLVHSEIKKLNQSYEKIIFSGWEWIGADKWFVALCGLILWLLQWFHSLIPNWGVAIVLLTLLVKFATLPLTLKQTSSMRKLQVHQPHLTAIRDKYRTDPRKMQAETMKYYKDNGVNPMAPIAGCLPMFLQMPIFIGLFVVIGRTLELRNAPFFGWITDLSSPDVFYSAIQIPMVMPSGLTILPILMAITTFYQAKQTTTDPNMKPLPYIMTIMMFLFSGTMPSGLLVYWIVSNTFSIIQYMIIGGPNTVPAVEVRGTPVKKK